MWVLTDKRFSDICRFTRHYLSDSLSTREDEWAKNHPRSAEYRWQHTLNVLENAEKIISGEGYDHQVTDVIRSAAILYDVSMFECEHKIHGQVSADIAKEYLTSQDYPIDFVERVVQAIAEHGVDFDTLSPDEMGEGFSLEGKVLIEADILDKLGASAVTNSLLYWGGKDHLPSECRALLEGGIAMQRASFFKDYLWTATGIAMAKDRYEFFLKFLEQLSDEVVEHSLPTSV